MKESMTKTFIGSDLHFGHRAILAFSPTRIKILGLDHKYSEFEIAHNYKVLKNDQTDRETKRLVKVFFEGLVADMNKAIIDQWNSIVGFSDIVYMLGDVSFARREETEKLLDRLHGRLYLVKGNHDHGTDELARFEWAKDYHFGNIEGQAVAMFHYPIFEWQNMHHGSFHLFGHVHGKQTQVTGRAMDVGVEATGQVVIPWDKVKSHLIKQEIRTHHDATREQKY